MQQCCVGSLVSFELGIGNQQLRLGTFPLTHSLPICVVPYREVSGTLRLYFDCHTAQVNQILGAVLRGAMEDDAAINGIVGLGVCRSIVGHIPDDLCSK